MRCRIFLKNIFDFPEFKFLRQKKNTFSSIVAILRSGRKASSRRLKIYFLNRQCFVWMLFLAPEEQVPVLYSVHPLKEQGHALLVVGDEAGGHVGLTVVGRRGLGAKINRIFLAKSKKEFCQRQNNVAFQHLKRYCKTKKQYR